MSNRAKWTIIIIVTPLSYIEGNTVSGKLLLNLPLMPAEELKLKGAANTGVLT